MFRSWSTSAFEVECVAVARDASGGNLRVVAAVGGDLDVRARVGDAVYRR